MTGMVAFLKRNRLQGVHRISLGVDLSEGLQPAREARNRIYRAAWEKEYDIEKAAQDANDPGVAHPSRITNMRLSRQRVVRMMTINMDAHWWTAREKGCR